MTEIETIQYVDSMDVTEKAKAYLNYFVNMISLKHNFETVDLSRFLLKDTSIDNRTLSPYHGWGSPDKELNRVAFYYIHKELKIKTFECFCGKANIRINETGCEDWKERGFASKSWTVIDKDSIYYYVYHSLN